VPSAFWQVNGNNGNLNNDNRNNKAFARPCRFVARAGECQGEGVSVRALYDAWREARRNKKPSSNQLAFELHWMDNLLDLQQQIHTGTWSPQPSICFVAQRPKAREIHAPDFSDRVVHHWLVPQLEAIYEPGFIVDSYSNRRGKGTHKAVARLRQYVRQVNSGEGCGWYLQLDVANFFPSIHRPTLWVMLKTRLTRASLSLTALHIIHALLRHPVQAQGVRYRCTREERTRVPMHKRLENAPAGCGLPIGNLSSQFFANVYLDALDQFVKHTLKAKRYLRFVDDFVLVHRDRTQLERWHRQIEQFLADRLRLKLKDDVRLRPLSAGIDFLGYVVFPTHTRVRKRVVRHAEERLHAWHAAHAARDGLRGTPEDFQQLDATWASYQGHFAHADSWRLRQRFLQRRPWLSALTNTRRRFHHQLSGRRIAVRISTHELPASISSAAHGEPPADARRDGASTPYFAQGNAHG
jgi:retron-type reverse transcriptase